MNPDKVWAIARFEFLSVVRTRGFLLTLIAIPLTLFLGAASMSRVLAPQSPRSGFVDHSGLLAQTDSGIGDLVRYADLPAALLALQKGSIGSVFVIPPDYRAGGSIGSYVRDAGPVRKPRSLHLDGLERALRTALTASLPQGDAALLIQPARVSEMTLTAGGAVRKTLADSERLKMILAPGLLLGLLLFVTMQASGYLLHSVSTERDTRILDVMLACVTPSEMLLGKLGGLGVASAIHPLLTILLMSSAWLPLFSWPPGAPSPWIAFLFMILGYTFVASFMTAVGMVVDVGRESNQVAAIWIFLNIVPVALLMSMSSWTSPGARLLSYFPFTAPVTMLARVGFSQTGTIDILLSAVTLMISTFLCIHAAARLARVSSLLRGKTPSLVAIRAALLQG